MAEKRNQCVNGWHRMSKTKKDIQLFGKWSFQGIEVNDLGLKKYISLRPIYLPHSMGRHEHRRFHKSEVNVVERLINNLMRPGKNAGKKTWATGALRNALEIIHLQTGRNPIEVLVEAVQNCAASEDTTRISYGGVVYHQAVDVSPQRRVDLALRLLAEGVRKAAFGKTRPFEECLAEELILASENNVRAYSVSKCNEMERIARSSR
ncbi:MAG: 30S ribosomal protein S7 [Candidatus Bathyarchaeota archaeon]|nr:MAG: 30S ribosomal protein S7 [Candidatus Bathyarchaeota archaeon]